MPARVVEALADLLTRRALWVAFGLLVLAVLAGTQLPRLRSDPSPEALVGGADGQAGTNRALDELVGDAPGHLLVVIEDQDVLRLDVLRFVHKLGDRLQALRGVERVISLTNMPLVHSSASQGGAVLADGDAVLADGDAVLPDSDVALVEGDDEETEALDLDALDAEIETIDAAEEATADQEFDAVLSVVEGDREHFANGLSTLADRLSSVRREAVVQGREVRAEDAAILREAIASSRLVRGRMISDDHRVSVVVTELDSELDEKQRIALVGAFREAIEAVGVPGGAQVRLAGVPALRESLLAKIRHDQRTLNPAVLILCVLVLMVAFRWWPAVVAPLVAVALTAVIVLGGMAALDQPLTIITNIIPPLLVIIGLSDSLHLIGRYQDELRRSKRCGDAARGDAGRGDAGRGDATGDGEGGPAEVRERATRGTLRAMISACFLTSVTTAVGFASLAVARSDVLRSFGVVAACGVMVAYVLTVGVVPVLVSRPRPPRLAARQDRVGQGVERLANWVLRRRGAVLVVAGCLLALCGWSASRLRADATLLDAFSPDDEVYQATRLLDRSLSGLRPVEVGVSFAAKDGVFAPEAVERLETVLRWANAQPAVLATLSPWDFLHEVSVVATGDERMRAAPFRSREHAAALATLMRKGGQGPLDRYLSADGRDARLTISLEDVGTRRSVAFLDALEARLANAVGSLPGVSVAFGGEGYTGSRGRARVLGELVLGLFGALVAILLMVALLFRSWRLALISLPANVAPVLLAAGYMSWRGIPLNLATAITYSIGVGLAVDGTIHFLARCQEEVRRGATPAAAISVAAGGTGRAIVLTCVTLALGFSVLALSSFVSVRQFGELITVTVVGCLISTVFLLPALLSLGGLIRRRG